MGMMPPLMEESRWSRLDYSGARPRRNVTAGRALAVMAILASVVPNAVNGQQGLPAPEPEQLMAFARAHVAINDARDAFHAEIGRTHEEQARQRARADFEARVAGILLEHDLTQEEYDRLILLVSLDGEIRAAFEAILAELGEERAAGSVA